MELRDTALHIARVSNLPVFLLNLESTFNDGIYFSTVSKEVLDLVDMVRLKAVGNINKHIPLFSFTLISGMVFLFISFPEKIQSLVFGPFYIDKPETESLIKDLENYYETKFTEMKINRIVDSIPVKDRIFMESWGILASRVFDLESSEITEFYEKTPAADRRYAVPDLAKTRMAETTVSYGYEFEHSMREAIKEADRSKLYSMLVPRELAAGKMKNESMLFNIQNRMVTNKFRQLKNLMIVLNTIFRLSAQDAGLPPIYLHSLSSSVATSIEECVNLDDMIALLKHMIDSYCDTINRAKLESHSFRITRVQKYILTHLAEDIDLDKLAEIAGTTKQHLSRQFKKECGVTITQYIRTQRINEAKIMIQTENSSMLLIAETLGFSSQNYFCDVFQKETGMTPSQYKSKCEKEKNLFEE